MHKIYHKHPRPWQDAGLQLGEFAGRTTDPGSKSSGIGSELPYKPLFSVSGRRIGTRNTEATAGPNPIPAFPTPTSPVSPPSGTGTAPCAPTMPAGPREHTILYEAPFDRCDREKDYETAWAAFEKRL